MSLTLTQKYALASAKIASAYATYKSLEKGAKFVADNTFKTLKYDFDLNYDLTRAAEIVASKARISLPWQTVAIEGQAEKEDPLDGSFAEAAWVFLHFPELRAKGVQARRVNGHMEFRSPSQSDLKLLNDKILAMKHARESDLDGSELDAEFTYPIALMSWNSKDKQWEGRGEKSRSLNSVIIPQDLREEIEGDIRKYLDSRSRLKRVEIPWRRGYLFEGPPGTGKTSMSLALACRLGFRLATLSLSEVDGDADLRAAVSKLRDRTVLVIEDIDTFAVVRDRDHEQSDGDLTLSGILNALDGFETPDGLVTICTTNHVEQLDPALMRPGRLDRIFTLDYIRPAEIESLFKWFYEAEAPEPCPPVENMTPAQVNEVFKQHFEDPEAGWNALMERIAPKPLLHVA